MKDVLSQWNRAVKAFRRAYLDDDPREGNDAMMQQSIALAAGYRWQSKAALADVAPFINLSTPYDVAFGVAR